jgi:hypothetical protein
MTEMPSFAWRAQRTGNELRAAAPAIAASAQQKCGAPRLVSSISMLGVTPVINEAHHKRLQVTERYFTRSPLKVRRACSRS